MKKLCIIGAGGHAKVLINLIKNSGMYEIQGCFDSNPELLGKTILGVAIKGTDNDLLKFEPDRFALINGIGSIQSGPLRETIYNKFKEKGFTFQTVIHSSAIVAEEIEIKEGAQIMAGAILQPGVVIGENSILNTGAKVDHDCQIGAHCHIAPGVTISGGVELGDCSHIGTGASVIQGVTIGSNVTVAAGATVINNVEDNSLVKGTPAR